MKIKFLKIKLVVIIISALNMLYSNPKAFVPVVMLFNILAKYAKDLFDM